MTDVQTPSSTGSTVSEVRPTIVDLVRTAAEDGATLVRGEIELAKAEARESAQRAGKGAALIVAAIFLALTAWLLLSFAAAYGLVAAGLPVWAALLIIATIYLLVGLVLSFAAKRELDRMKGLERTQASVQETIDEAKAAFTPPTAA